MVHKYNRVIRWLLQNPLATRKQKLLYVSKVHMVTGKKALDILNTAEAIIKKKGLDK